VAFGGNEGNDLSRSIGDCTPEPGFGCAAAAARDFFLRLFMIVSWHCMQKIPADVRA
jgi:hypothetical protein